MPTDPEPTPPSQSSTVKSIPDAEFTSVSDIEQFANAGFEFGRVVVPVPHQHKEKKKGKLGHEYAKHAFIGDTIKLTLADHSQVVASDYKFCLPNGLTLTYGQINALAGDFYGTHNPISGGRDAPARSALFLAAYESLASANPRQPMEANDLLHVLRTEVDAVNNALENHEDPSIAYSALPDVSLELEAITSGRSGVPSYFGLAKKNWDHFGEDARTAYHVGHTTAIEKAISGALLNAYAMNAFADHFLEDSFSSGHLRTPRRCLQKTTDPTADLCAKFMHDEDCAIGLRVRSRDQQSWTCFGNKRALDNANQKNMQRCVAAVQTSADEIYRAYVTKRIPSTYAALEIAPTLDSARSKDQPLAPLFKFQVTGTLDRRADIKKRRNWQFTDDWSFSTTAFLCKTSGYWNYPINLDGVHVVLPRTSVSAKRFKTQTVVFYQKPDWRIAVRLYPSGIAFDSPIVSLPFSPLASTNLEEQRPIRLFYLDKECFIQECAYFIDSWSPGDVGCMKAKACLNSRIAIVSHLDNHSILNLRVYYQEYGSFAIRELHYDGSRWRQGILYLTGALEGTSIAAVAHRSQNEPQTHIRMYYQTEDLSLKEHAYNNIRWSPGKLDPGKAPSRTPIRAVYHPDRAWSSRLSVFWHGFENNLVVATGNLDSTIWGTPMKVVEGAGSDFQFDVLRWENRFVKIYQQNVEGVLLEHCSDDDGKTWSLRSEGVGGVVP